MLRPANLGGEDAPGRGVTIRPAADGTPVAVINLQGALFLDVAVHPFLVVDELVGRLASGARIVLVDFHAEATSEKIALARILDGRVTGVFGTHTHVQTNDARVLPGGTAAITDAGMTGPHDSVIGVRADLAIKRMQHRVAGAFPPGRGRRPDRGRRRRVRGGRSRYGLSRAPRPRAVATARASVESDEEEVAARGRATRRARARRRPSSGTETRVA